MSNTDSEMGKSGRQLITLFRTKPIDPDDQPELAREVLETRTKLTSETGYMMVFGEQHHRQVSTHTANALGGDGYPVSQNAFDSLPPYVQATLDRDGAVQILAQYDPDAGGFVDIDPADEPTPEELVDWIATNIGNGLSLHEAVDYLAVEVLDHYTEEEWATVREVGSEAVRSNVLRAKEKHEPL